MIIELKMILPSVLIGLLMVFQASARYIEEPNFEKVVEWRPDKLRKQPLITPENSWILLKRNENVAPISAKTTLMDLFLTSQYSLKDLVKLTSFYLYTENNRDNPQQLFLDNLNSIRDSNWNPSVSTKIIIHGFVSDSNDAYVIHMKNKFLNLNESMNVITFDWGRIANLFYPTAASYTDKVGNISSFLIDVLCNDFGGDVERFHLIGHSLGAHVAGFAAKFATSGKLSRVTGLDPAYPGFITEDQNGRLDSSDATFVDCIHTCGGLVAFESPICHADYYPNGGTSPQPGCSGFIQSTSCSHSRSHELFIESIMEDHMFPAYTCSDVPDVNPVKCISDGAFMGYPAHSEYTGIFYAVTNDKFPYAPAVTTMDG